jgi:hypothetical protein
LKVGVEPTKTVVAIPRLTIWLLQHIWSARTESNRHSIRTRFTAALSRHLTRCAPVLEHPTGVKPVTSRFVAKCSVQLSYGCVLERTENFAISRMGWKPTALLLSYARVFDSLESLGRTYGRRSRFSRLKAGGSNQRKLMSRITGSLRWLAWWVDNRPYRRPVAGTACRRLPVAHRDAATA